jgi:hypothetical protein
MLLEAIRRTIELRRKLAKMQAEYEKKKRKERVYKYAAKEIEETLGAHVKLPPREQWEIEPFEVHVCTEDMGWMDIFLRIKIDDLELFAGASSRENEDLVFFVRGQCPDCQKYLYYKAPLYSLEGLMWALRRAESGIHSSYSVCTEKIKRYYKQTWASARRTVYEDDHE